MNFNIRDPWFAIFFVREPVWICATDRSDKILSQRQWFSHVTRGDLLQQPVAATCRSDLSHRVSRPLRYCATTEFNNCFVIRSPSLFSYLNHSLTAHWIDTPSFTRERGYNHAWAEYYLQQNTFRWYYAWADHYISAVFCRSRNGLSANETEEDASNDNFSFHSMHFILLFIGREPTTWPGLLLPSTVSTVCFAANNILLMLNYNHDLCW